MSLSFGPATSTSYVQGNISSIAIHFPSDLVISLVRMRRISVNSASGLKTAITIVFSVHDMICFIAIKTLALLCARDICCLHTFAVFRPAYVTLLKHQKMC